MSRLRDRVAVVTGAGRGLGAEMARSLARRGASVVINDVHREGTVSAASQLAAEIQASGGSAVSVDADISTWRGSQQLIEQAVDAYGSVHALVTCAGNSVQTPISAITEREWQSSIDVHVTGTLACAQAAAAFMVGQGTGGSIVTIASRGAFLGAGAAYAAAKAAIMGMTTAMSLSLTPHGIAVNCLLPSAITSLFPFAGPRTQGGVPPSIDMGPQRVTPLVDYLASREAEGITGNFFYISGGDIIIYRQPMAVNGAAVLLRTAGAWNPDRLDSLIRPVIGVGGTPWASRGPWASAPGAR